MTLYKNIITCCNIELIVITDGEAILGIGDQGIAGIDICIAKLIVYSICGGISPYRTLPVIIDVGTNNPNMLENPFYQGTSYIIHSLYHPDQSLESLSCKHHDR